MYIEDNADSTEFQDEWKVLGSFDRKDPSNPDSGEGMTQKPGSPYKFKAFVMLKGAEGDTAGMYV